MLVGCAAQPVGEPIARSPRTIAAFAVEGRVAIRSGQERHSARIVWRHAAERDEILLMSPLGQGVAELTRDAAGARLATADRKEYVASDWESLSAQVFGFALPLSGIPRWLAGHPPAAGDGWRVDYLDYESDAIDALPTLIELKRNDLELRLKVDEWSDVR